MTLITTKQMEAIRAMAQKGMISTVEIYRRDAVVPTGSNDYGDNVEYNETTESRRATVQGWLYTASATGPEVDNAAIVTDQMWALRLPIGTEIATGDRVVVDGSDFYVVSTDKVKTYAPYITANLRRRLG